MTLRVILLCALAVLLGAPAAAHAARGACLAGVPGPACTVWTGTVTSVDDGDTITVDLDRDRSRARYRLRVSGIQAMEQTVYAASRRAGECHAVEATLRLERLIRASKKRVRLSALEPATRSRHRLLRFVAVKLHGRWRDAGSILTAEGRALWLPQRVEWAGNARYRAITQLASAAQIGLFDPDGCGVGPSPASPLRLWVNWDADGSDSANPDDEWVVVRNLDPVNPVGLGGWHLRDSSLRRYTFAPDAVIAPGGRIRVDVGRGGDGDLSWGLRAPLFDNVSTDGTDIGDGAYLFDPLGNIRAAMIYPCGPQCTDPLQGAVQIAVRPRRPERVTLTNVSAAPVDLDGYELKSAPWSYHFGAGTVIGPGESLRVDVKGDPAQDTPLVRHWGLANDILDNGGDVVRLLTYTDVTIACADWGARSCA